MIMSLLRSLWPVLLIVLGLWVVRCDSRWA
jgi:hypothetical protein